MKAYIIERTCYMWDDCEIIGVILDKTEAEQYVKKKNIKYDQWEKSHKKCCECRENGKFRFKKSCKYCVIKQDRHGSYCKNDRSDEYSGGQKIQHYYMYETDILEKQVKNSDQ